MDIKREDLDRSYGMLYGNPAPGTASLYDGTFDAQFDDPLSTSMIEDQDLLDLDGPASPDPSHVRRPSGQYLSPPVALGSFTSNTPPVPDSTSPFDDFMLRRYVPGQGITSTLQQHMKQQHQPHQQQTHPQQHQPVYAQKFLQDNGLSTSLAVPTGTPPQLVPPQQSASLNSINSGQLQSSSVISVGSGGSLDDKQQQLLAERRRRRRESHNAVERRRRDNINDKIKELSELLPEPFLNAGATVDAYQGMAKGDDKPNKGTVLSKSVDYIRHLQNIIDNQNSQERQLQAQVNDLQIRLGLEPTKFEYTSAELALSQIGMGPVDDKEFYYDDYGSR